MRSTYHCTNIAQNKIYYMNFVVWSKCSSSITMQILSWNKNGRILDYICIVRGLMDDKPQNIDKEVNNIWYVIIDVSRLTIQRWMCWNQKPCYNKYYIYLWWKENHHIFLFIPYCHSCVEFLRSISFIIHFFFFFKNFFFMQFRCKMSTDNWLTMDVNIEQLCNIVEEMSNI